MGKIKDYIKQADKMRNEWATSDAKRDSGLTEPDNIKAIKDVEYTFSETEDEKVWHLTDIYYPTEVDITKYPVIVNVHGGGWFYGDKELYRHYCMKLASYGYAVVNFNYRRSPEYQYPAGFMDVCHLFEFLAINADKYSFDMDNLYAVGDSAGAQLLSQYSIWATNAEYKVLLDKVGDMIAPIPKRIALNCGIYNMRDMLGRENLVEWYLDDETMADTAGVGDVANSFFNVIDYVNSSFPETFLMLSVNDDLRVHTIPMKDKLDEVGVPFIFKQYGEGSPEDGHVFHVNMKSAIGAQCNDDEIEFFRKGI